MPELLSDLPRLGVEYDTDITVDTAGAAMHDGGMCATLRDPARFGQMLLDGGRPPMARQVVPAGWVEDASTGDALPARLRRQPHRHTDAGRHVPEPVLVPCSDRAVLLCLSLHGQMVHVNPAAATVGVELSSWPAAQYATLMFDTLAMFDALAAHPS